MRKLNRNIRTELRGNLNASGTLTLTFTVPLGPTWEVKQVSISGNSTLEPQASSYIGIGSSGVFVSNSLTGNGDTDDTPNVLLRSGDSFSLVWTGGTSGALMKVAIIYDEVGE